MRRRILKAPAREHKTQVQFDIRSLVLNQVRKTVVRCVIVSEQLLVAVGWLAGWWMDATGVGLAWRGSGKGCSLARFALLCLIALHCCSAFHWWK